METQIDLIVKHESVKEFIKKAVIIQGDRVPDRNEELNPYYVFGKSNVFVRKYSGYDLVGSKRVAIALRDRARESGTELLHTYTYLVSEYDSISFELKLVDFKVENV